MSQWTLAGLTLLGGCLPKCSERYCGSARKQVRLNQVPSVFGHDRLLGFGCMFVGWMWSRFSAASGNEVPKGVHGCAAHTACVARSL